MAVLIRYPSGPRKWRAERARRGSTAADSTSTFRARAVLNHLRFWASLTVTAKTAILSKLLYEPSQL